MLLPPARGKSWVFQVTALCIVLGMMLALSLKTQRERYGGVPNHSSALSAEFANLKKQNVDLQKDVAQYRSVAHELAKKLATGDRGSAGLEEALESTRLLAGTSAAHGPGIIVTLRDSPQLNRAETREEVVSDYVVHDYDIRQVANELFAAGAEAIAVNDQRLISTSSIRCVGPVVLVNVQQVGPPYEIKAVGDSDVLAKALELPNGPAEGLFLLDMIVIKKLDDISLPAYKGSTRFNYLKTLDEREKSRPE